MIIYGTKAKEISKEILTDKCENCGSQNSIYLHVFQKYAHIFWIPFFPIGKTAVSQCEHCKQVLKLKQMPDNIEMSYENLKGQSKAPVWMYSGIALVAILITIGVIADKQNDAKNAKLILAPKKGDIFEIKTKDNQYTLLKVEDLKGDTIYVRFNNYETDKRTGFSKLKSKGDSSYSEEIEAVNKSDLKSMFDKGDILDIDRD